MVDPPVSNPRPRLYLEQRARAGEAVGADGKRETGVLVFDICLTVDVERRKFAGRIYGMPVGSQSNSSRGKVRLAKLVEGKRKALKVSRPPTQATPTQKKSSERR